MELDEMIALMAAAMYDGRGYGEEAAMREAVRKARRLWAEVLKPGGEPDGR